MHVQTETAEQKKSGEAGDKAMLVLTAFVVVIVLGILGWSFEAADDSGWIPHNRYTYIVKFWGRIVRRDGTAHENGVQWRCVKQSESFTCYALN